MKNGKAVVVESEAKFPVARVVCFDFFPRTEESAAAGPESGYFKSAITLKLSTFYVKECTYLENIENLASFETNLSRI